MPRQLRYLALSPQIKSIDKIKRKVFNGFSAFFFFANLGLARSGFKRRLWLSKICSGTKRIVRRPLSVDVGRTRGFFKQCELGDSIRKKDVGTIQVRIWVSIRPETHWKWDIIVLNQSISWWWEQNRSRWIPIPLDCRLEFPATNSKWGQCEKKSPDPILRLASYRSPSRHLQNTQLPPLKEKIKLTPWWHDRPGYEWAPPNITSIETTLLTYAACPQQPRRRGYLFLR